MVLWYNERMEFTERQKVILVGSILGDGGIYARKEWNPYYYVKQAERNKKYIFWLYRELCSFCPSEPKQRRDNRQWYFYSSGLESLRPLRRIFYDNGRKRIPKNIGEFLNLPLSLAIWYMDDGTLDYRAKDHCALSLTVNCFTVQEVELLSRTLEENFGIISTVQTPLCRGKRYPKLYIGARGRERLLELITPYIHKCFAYKLPQNRVSPSETKSVPPWCGGDRRYLTNEEINSYHTPGSPTFRVKWCGMKI